MSAQVLKKPDIAVGNFEISESFINVRDHKLCVRSCGPENGPVILFMHGIQSHAGVWEKISADLAASGYRVVAFDRRGHGHSDHCETYHLFDYISDLGAVVESITDKAFTLVGHCESSVITALYAGAFPQKISNLLFIQFPIAPRKPMDDSTKADLIATYLKKLAISNKHSVVSSIDEAAQRSIQGAPFPMPEEVALHVAQRNVKPYQGGYIWRWDPMILNYRLLYNTIDMSIVGASLAKVSAPVTFIYGNESSLMKTDKERHLAVTRDLKPGAKQVLVAGGHYPHMEADSHVLVKVILDSLGK